MPKDRGSDPRRQVGRLPADEFMSKFSPGYPYEKSKNWDDLMDNDDFWEGPDVVHQGETDWTSDISVLTNSVAKHGIKKPVRVGLNGQVVDGHHRVYAARQTGKPVPYTVERY